MRVLPLSSNKAQKVLDVITGIWSSSEFLSWLSDQKWVSAGNSVLLMSAASPALMPLTSVSIYLSRKLVPFAGPEDLVTLLSGVCTVENMVVRDSLPLFLTPGTDSLAVSFVVPTIFVGTFFLSSEVGESL